MGACSPVAVTVVLVVALLLAALSFGTGIILMAAGRDVLAGLLLVWDGIALAWGVPAVCRLLLRTVRL